MSSTRTKRPNKSGQSGSSSRSSSSTRRYRYLDENAELQHISTDSDAVVELHFAPKAGQKAKNQLVSFKEILVKGAQTRGIRLSKHKVRKVTFES